MKRSERKKRATKIEVGAYKYRGFTIQRVEEKPEWDIFFGSEWSDRCETKSECMALIDSNKD